ncbi:hypothetical protein EG329_010112 [Mollisiaceae sp. DMI_Dod_QoI]|nr:hypothetical protein EG329_010112 [Helotiales sp. DMI_Dod_QoI]
MATRKWDAYAAFDVTGRHSRGMNCIGENRHGRRCAWDIPNEKYVELRRLLDHIETKSPREAEGFLRDIASLSLCQDFHQNQAYGFMADWRAMLQDIAARIPAGPTVEERNKFLEERFTADQKEKGDLQVQLEQSKTRAVDQVLAISQQLKDQYNSKVEALSTEIREQVIAETNAKMQQYVQLAAAAEGKKVRNELVENLEKLNADLLKQLEKGQMLNADLLKQVDSDAATMGSLNSQLRQADTDRKKQLDDAELLRAEIEAERKNSQNLTIQLGYSKLENRKDTDALIMVEEELATERSTSHKLGEEVDRLKVANTQLAEEKETLEAATHKLGEEVERLKAENASLEEELFDENELYVRAREELSVSENNLSIAKSDASKAAETLAETLKLLEDSRREFANTQSEMESKLKKATETAAEKQAELERKMKEATETAAQKQAELERKLEDALSTSTQKQQEMELKLKETTTTSTLAQNELSTQLSTILLQHERARSRPIRFMLKSYVQKLPVLPNWKTAVFGWLDFAKWGRGRTKSRTAVAIPAGENSPLLGEEVRSDAASLSGHEDAVSLFGAPTFVLEMLTRFTPALFQRIVGVAKRPPR